jgi:hypothetical protein
MESVNSVAQSLVSDSDKIVVAAAKFDEVEIGTLIESTNESIKKLVSMVCIFFRLCRSESEFNEFRLRM